MKNINIPEPCSEDWNEMTPNEKGAFCQKCALDVYDFTNKSASEIREVLTLNMANPVCMRIEPRQLDELNNDFLSWKIQNKKSYQRAWVFTLFVVFGMTLFSCEEDEEPVVKEYQKVGQAILNQTEEKKVIDPTVPSNVDKELNKADSGSSELGLENQSNVDLEEIAVMGEPIYVEERPEKVHTMDEVHVVSRVERLRDSYALGGVPMISPEYNEYLTHTKAGVTADSLEINIKPQITALAYPNPATNQITVKVNMSKRGKGDVELITLNGKKIRTIHSGRIKKGESLYPIDLTGLETGMYLVVIYSGEMKETIKFSKL